MNGLNCVNYAAVTKLQCSLILLWTTHFEYSNFVTFVAARFPSEISSDHNPLTLCYSIKNRVTQHNTIQVDGRVVLRNLALTQKPHSRKTEVVSVRKLSD